MTIIGLIPKMVPCGEQKRLLDDLLWTLRAITALLEEQMYAVIEDDPDFPRFGILLHYAQDQKEQAKYAWISHVEMHECG